MTTTSKQITRFIKRSMHKGVDPYNTLDAALELRAADNARRNGARAKRDECLWRDGILSLAA